MTQTFKLLLAGTALSLVTGAASAETLRIMTWGGYAPEELIAKFEEENPDIDVEVTFSNNEEMIAKLRATGGSGFDLAQPSHDRIFAAQQEYNIYKPMDLEQIDTSVMSPNLLEGVKQNATIDGEVYAVPHQWGTSGVMTNMAEAPDVTGWNDLCDPQYAGKTSMRLRRTILLGTAFGMGMNPFELYSDKEAYQDMLDQVTQKLIDCKSVIKTYWTGGDDLSALMLSGEVVVSETWDFDRVQALQREPRHRVHPAGNRRAGLDRHLCHPARRRGGRGGLQVDQLRAAPREHRDHVGLDRSDRGRPERHRPASRRQARRGSGGLRSGRPRQPQVLCQHSRRTRGHGRHCAGTDQGGAVDRETAGRFGALTRRATGAPRQGKTMYDLSCKSVTKRFGTFTAVDGVSFDVPSGSFFSILGPSGCGKTTLMRMIAGFETPGAGDILIKGQSVLNRAPNKRNVKMVFQHLALFPMMNIGENIAYGLRCRGESKSAIVDKVRAVLDRVGLPGVEDKQVSQLSGGQKQRIAIARCMVLEPDVLLLDEPLGALDLKLREHMKIELKQLQHQFETTFLYITHDQSEALVMSDNVAVMNAGRFEQIGPPRALYENPVSGFVAGFVGDANRWAGRIDRLADGTARVALEGGGSVLARIGAQRLSSDADVEVFVRPEAIAIGHGEQGASLSGQVDSLLFNGASSRILVRTDDGRLVEVADTTAAAGDVAKGERIDIHWPLDRALCFARAAAP